MHALSAPSVLARLALVAVALAAFLMACADAPESFQAGSASVADAPEASAPALEDALNPSPEASEAEAESGQAPSAEPVTETPAPPATAAQPKPPGVISAPLPERPPMPAPPPIKESPSPRNTAAADAFWITFQRAVRSRDRAAIARGLADQIRVGDQTFSKSSQEAQAVLQAIVEEEAARDAYLAVDRLTHGANGSTFETTAHYSVEGEPYEVIVFGRVAEVAPGDWRLVEVGSR